MKGTLWSGINKFWVIQNNKPVIDNIIKSNKRSAARSMCTFDFSTLYTKIPHTKLLFVLDKIIEFAFKGGTRDTITVNESGAYWVKDNSRMKGIKYSKSSIKDAIKFLLENCYFNVGSLLFRQVIGIPMGSDPAPFFANLFSFTMNLNG